MNNNKSLKIGIITPYKNFEGGVETVNARLIKAFSAHSVQLITTENLILSKIQRLKQKFFSTASLAKVALQQTSSNFDVIICNGEFGFLIDHPCCINLFHGSALGFLTNTYPFLPFKERCLLRRDALIQRKSSQKKFVVAVSTYLQTVLSKQGIATDQIIENGVDLQHFQPDESVSRNNRFLFVGAGHYYGKGWDVLDALVNNGAPIDAVCRNNPSSKVPSLKVVKNHHMADIYKRYQMLIFPSRFEGLGLAAIEAMACGTPVLMNNVGLGPKLHHYIPDFVLNTLDPLHWQDRIDKIRANWKHYSILAREYAEAFHCHKRFAQDWNFVLQKYTDKLLSNNSEI